MRLTFRLLIPLAILLGFVALTFLPIIDKQATKLLSSQDENIQGIAFCNGKQNPVYKSPQFPPEVNCKTKTSDDFRIATSPVTSNGKTIGYMLVVHDLRALKAKVSEIKIVVLTAFVLLSILILSITGFAALLSWRWWMQGFRALLRRETLSKPFSQVKHKVAPELRPLVHDLRGLLHDMHRGHAPPDSDLWNPQTLKAVLQKELSGDEVLVVSNREPYAHVKKGDKVEVQFPASGLVTALEPIMRACSGTWIAHGSGSADKETVDHHDHVQVPPDNPSYQIRRIWLTEQEESGYYYGFANEGLWALCHIAHVRPIFRSEDWQQYVNVNQKFADAVVQEAKTDDPVVLVQDYHFALLPKMIKEKLPKATVIMFWHIPFPNPEVFSICPWRKEILEGLLGSSILGFHTRMHCTNFMDSVDRLLETRIDREQSTISFGGELTAVNSYPISIEYPVRWHKSQKTIKEARAKVRADNNLPKDRLVGLGVDRLDYTKGILERFSAVERLLELHPKWIGKFTFIQIAAPSRSAIEQYRNFEIEVRALAEKINERFGKPGYKPIELRIRHHGPEEVYEYYRGSDLCFVSSLHDGMNLVAKEFVASRDDEQGSLILSQFTGASVELPEALIVNPYNIDQCAAALNFSLEMSKDEQRQRMRAMRGLIQEFNVYRWAGTILLDAAQLRQRAKLSSVVPHPTLDSLRFTS